MITMTIVIARRAGVNARTRIEDDRAPRTRRVHRHRTVLKPQGCEPPLKYDHEFGLTMERRVMALKSRMRPVHPGEILKEDFLKPAGLSVNALAKALHVPTPRLNDIVLKRRGISADTAMRLARYFGGDA
jgi:addiction module HigA family antidote